MQLNKYDVERIVQQLLSQLTLELNRGDFTNPNDRTILLKHNGEVIDYVTFDVRQRDEYED